MRGLLGMTALLAAMPLARVTAQGSPTPPQPQIVTTAMGEATVIPDRASIIFALETRAPTAAAAAAENARRQKAVIDALRGKGIGAEQITTAGYTVSADERYDKGQRQVVGYIARNSVVVEVLKTDMVGTLIDAALGAGSNMVSGLRFYSSVYESTRRTALERAVVKARADAEVMARAAGGEVGDPIEIQTMEMGMPRPMMEMADARMMASSEAQTETPIVVGEQKVTVSVTTRWQFVPRPR